LDIGHEGVDPETLLHERNATVPGACFNRGPVSLPLDELTR